MLFLNMVFFCQPCESSCKWHCQQRGATASLFVCLFGKPFSLNSYRHWLATLGDIWMMEWHPNDENNFPVLQTHIFLSQFLPAPTRLWFRVTPQTMQVVSVNLRTDGKYSRQPQKRPAQGCHRREAPLPFFALKQSVLPTVVIHQDQQLTTTIANKSNKNISRFSFWQSSVLAQSAWGKIHEARRHFWAADDQRWSGDELVASTFSLHLKLPCVWCLLCLDPALPQLIPSVC